MLAGSLHDHSTDSDGDWLDTAIVDWLFAHHAEVGIDYAALSDHSDFFPVTAGVVETPVNAIRIPPSRSPGWTSSATTVRQTVTVGVNVPTAPSPRPDGRHFLYAIAHAGDPVHPARCWTGPLLTAA